MINLQLCFFLFYFLTMYLVITLILSWVRKQSRDPDESALNNVRYSSSMSSLVGFVARRGTHRAQTLVGLSLLCRIFSTPKCDMVLALAIWLMANLVMLHHMVNTINVLTVWVTGGPELGSSSRYFLSHVNSAAHICTVVNVWAKSRTNYYPSSLNF